ncbi:MAG: ABC transporter permease [Abitibacteriaceae bacterium]|nr:ABC transporter permease [Abditibacteriaceae bacterium]MBV9865087.1 ABC transporter permease [Abditibacteriaceae bacterium]
MSEESPSSLLRALPSGFRILLALVIALFLCGFFIRLAGQDPLIAGKALIAGALGSSARRAESLSKTIPLIMTGLSVAIAFRAGFFNVGAEGQFLMGALVAAGLGTKAGLPMPLILCGGTVAGAIWALVAGWLKMRRGAPEIITTIMLNYIALQIVAFAVGDQGPLQEAERTQPQTDLLPLRAQLPALIPNTNLHAGLFIALLCALVCWWLLFRTERGFLMRAVGANPLASRAAGIRVESNVQRAVALCGALSGLGGAMEVAGSTKYLGQGGFGYGYTAIAVALLGGLNPLGVLPAALLFGMLDAGGKAMERDANVPAVTVSIVIGIVIFVMAAIPKLRLQVQ